MKKYVAVVLLSSLVFLGFAPKNADVRSENADITNTKVNIDINKTDQNQFKAVSTILKIVTPPANQVKPKDDKKYIALTFDDGPHHIYTNRILKVLKDNDSKATFYVVGNRVNANSKTLKATFEQGNQIGNHTYSHIKLTKISTQSIKQEITKTNKVIFDILKINITTARSPYGAYNKNVISSVEMPLIDWSMDTRDWQVREKDKIVKNVIDKAKDGDIVLMHDIYESTSDAVEEIVPKLKEKGFELVTVDELLGETKKGKVYDRK